MLLDKRSNEISGLRSYAMLPDMSDNILRPRLGANITLGHFESDYD